MFQTEHMKLQWKKKNLCSSLRRNLAGMRYITGNNDAYRIPVANDVYRIACRFGGYEEIVKRTFNNSHM